MGHASATEDGLGTSVNTVKADSSKCTYEHRAQMSPDPFSHHIWRIVTHSWLSSSLLPTPVSVSVMWNLFATLLHYLLTVSVVTHCSKWYLSSLAWIDWRGALGHLSTWLIFKFVFCPQPITTRATSVKDNTGLSLTRTPFGLNFNLHILYLQFLGLSFPLWGTHREWTKKKAPLNLMRTI